MKLDIKYRETHSTYVVEIFHGLIIHWGCIWTFSCLCWYWMINILDWFDLLRILLWFVNVIIAQCSIITIGTLKTYYFFMKESIDEWMKGKKEKANKSHPLERSNKYPRKISSFLSAIRAQEAVCSLCIDYFLLKTLNFCI